jgi:hypothetical protein
MKKIAINLFIVLNLMMMARAQFDSKSPLINFIYKPVSFVQNYFSMWRGWQMFAPNPLRTNQYIDAKVTLENGKTIIWDFPRPSNSSLFERYMWGERFRKYTSDALRLDSKNYLWKDAGVFVIKKIKEKYPNKKVSEVTLRRRWLDIPNWNTSFIPHRQIPKETYKTFEYYTLKVKSL